MRKGLNEMNKRCEGVFKNGKSKGISVRKERIEVVKLEVGDKVEVEEMNGGVLMKKKEEWIEDRIRKF
ncbi:AbrB family transcriptional regulator, partial [Staphylococcus epidermidis]|uniref:AbrB family transcriptional regulator n=1 Tax=Staphylococcus epidermidis TaxID=1282 RepID=UPI00119E8535